MATKAVLWPNLTNHSGRKTMMQILRDAKVPPTDIVQLSGHKNLQSVNINYNKISEEEQLGMSKTLSNATIVSSREVLSNTPKTTRPEFSSMSTAEHNLQVSSSRDEREISMFRCATISGGNINIIVNPRSPQMEKRSSTFRRLRPMLDSDSD